MSLNFFLASLAAFFLGLSKGGLKGMGILVVALTALAYGAKNSTGILVPLLIVGDILAVIYFKRHVKWQHLIRFLPAALIGILVAVYIGNDWEEVVFKKWLSAIILVSVLYMFWTEYSPVKMPKISWKFSYPIGFAAGFTTMIGNLAGPFANLYFLATRLPKNEIVATSAWVFFVINLFKLPFHIFAWETIRVDTLWINLTLVPFVITGFFVGTRILKLFNEKGFRTFLLIVTAIGAVLILFK